MKDILGFQGEYRWLSNFAPATIEFNSLAFPHIEGAYVASKTLDSSLQREISAIVNPGEVKRLGRTLSLRPDWDQFKDPFMLQFTRQKYAHSEYRKLLLATGNAYLEETNAWGDRYWGVCNGTGLNKLGHIIMAVRQEIRVGLV